MSEALDEIRELGKALEGLSKRLRRVEILSRLSSDTGIDEFLELIDVDEDTFLGNAGLFVRVKLDSTGLEFSQVGSACVTFECTSPGWRAYGGSPIRTLVHESAFQLDADGDDRGDYAVDLQQVRFNDNEVAGGYTSFIFGDENSIHPDTYYCVILGTINYIDSLPPPDETWAVYIMGGYSEVFGETYGINIQGENMYVESSTYCFLAGYGHALQDATSNGITSGPFGIFSLIEGNDFISVASVTGGPEDPTYSGAMGILCEQRGDVFLTFQMGESEFAYGEEDYTTMWNSMTGFESYIRNVMCNYTFGQGIRSWAPSTTNYYDGRLLLSGDYPNKFPAIAAAGQGSGFNQSSLFSQNDLIADWPAAFTTSRFQFPIIPDSIWYFEAWIAGTEQGCANSFSWKIEGVVENDGGVTTILAQTVTNVYRDVATKEWQAAADDANDRLIFQYRDTAGPTSDDCNIQFFMRTTEVGWKA